MIKKDIKRIFMISDIHFGVRANSLEWLENHKKYFYEFLIPLLKENSKEGDYLFVLGDVFESRQTLNVLVINESLKIFNEISKILPIYIIIGNHDCYRKTTSEINSPKIFESIDNVKIFSEFEVIFTNGKKLLLMPWQEEAKDELNIIRNYNADYMFCHTHFGGVKFNQKTLMYEGINISEVSKYKKVYSGHIHYRQTLKNVEMIGSPYQITRNDIGNKKKVYLLDVITGEEKTFNNNISPVFLKYKIDDMLEISHEDFQNQIKNNYIDIIIDGKWISSFPYSLFIESLTGFMKIEYILSTLTKDYEDEETITNIEELNLDDLIKDYINSLPYNESMQNNLLKVSDNLYKKAIKVLEEKTTEISI